jgi:regulator of replication initiation timing
MLVNNTSTQTEQNGIHLDTPKQPLHQGVVDVTSGEKTKVIGNLGPQGTCPEANNTGGNADKAAKYQDERFSGAPPFKTNREAADHYYNMYKELELKNTRLTNLHAKLETEISNVNTSNTKLYDENGKHWDANKQLRQLGHDNKQLHAENQQLKQALKEEKNSSSAATKKADQLKEQLDDLYRSHIHSINSVNTGLDPISDRTFEEKFGSIHDEVGF